MDLDACASLGRGAPDTVGTLNNEVVANPDDLHFGQELAIRYGQIREHGRPWQFRKN
jgi:hypothetical protein